MSYWNDSFELLKSVDSFGKESLSKGLWTTILKFIRRMGTKSTKPVKAEIKPPKFEVLKPPKTDPKVTRIPTAKAKRAEKAEKIAGRKQLDITAEDLKPITREEVATSQVVSLPRVRTQKTRDFLDKIKQESKAKTKADPKYSSEYVDKFESDRRKILNYIEGQADLGVSASDAIKKNPEIQNQLKKVRVERPNFLPNIETPKAKVISIKSAKDKPNN